MKSAHLLLAWVVFGILLVAERPAAAQGSDNVLNGALIRGAVGAGVGVAFTHAVRDSDLTAGQYAYGALCSALSAPALALASMRCSIVGRRTLASRISVCSLHPQSGGA